MEETQNLLGSDLQIDAIAHTHLVETSKWCKFLSILGFIFTGIFVLVALFAGTLLGSISSPYGGGAIIGAGFVTIIYLIIAAVNFFAALFLYRFATKMKAALYTSDQDTLNNSFLNLKNLYKYLGVLAIIYLALIVLFLVFGIGAAVFMR
jgi:Family of unknown function (DUF5362)